jgi:hypothetical protein
MVSSVLQEGDTLPIGRSLASLQISIVFSRILRPERLPTWVKKCGSHTFIQRTSMKSDFNSGWKRSSKGFDVKVFVFRELENEWRRFEPTTTLTLLATFFTSYLSLLYDRVDDDVGQVRETCTTIFTTISLSVSKGHSSRILLMN